ncbi:glutathione synthase [Ottowia oryzae]|uniref:Glutathione synthetase n=1 Tax=Ottowia oryzae TaxID=2109914 RepID=A0A2S0MD13_9BURK|nr:glutathione synthase [Ottowia oryzae]AVO33706.1 glutathione synthase [Ottowia oryzae]
MNLLVIADPLDHFKIYKDTTFAMLREAARRGHALTVCEPRDMRWQTGQPVMASVRDIALTGDAERWYTVNGQREVALREFDAVLMRKDPPFDAEFIYATHLLSQAEREGACVINEPASLREHPEKLAVMEFPQFIGPTLVTRSADDVRAFHAEHGDIICKPLDGMGGMGIFRVKADGLNLGSIIETLNHHGAITLMVQKFLPEIAEGDKRVLIIDGEPVPFCLARIPQGTEVRGNLAAGGKGVAQPLTDTDRATARAIGQVLAPRGLLLIGLDIIGTKVTEINVTSPTGFQEITQQTGCDVAALFIDAVERHAAAHVSAGTRGLG